MAGPPIRDPQAGEVRRPHHAARDRRRGAGRRVSKRWRSSSSRTASSSRSSRSPTEGRPGQAGRRRSSCSISREIGKQAVPELQSGHAADRRHRGPQGASAASARSHRPRRARLQGPARAAAGLGGVDASLHQSRRRRDGGLPRDAGGRDVGRGGRRHRVSRATRRPAPRSKASRSPTPRCASRSSRCCTIRI